MIGRHPDVAGCAIEIATTTSCGTAAVAAQAGRDRIVRAARLTARALEAIGRARLAVVAAGRASARPGGDRGVAELARPDDRVAADLAGIGSGVRSAVDTPSVRGPGVEGPAVERPSVESPSVESPSVERSSVRR